MFKFSKNHSKGEEVESKEERVTFIVEFDILPSKKRHEIEALLEMLKRITHDFGEKISIKYDAKLAHCTCYVTCSEIDVIDELGDYLELDLAVQTYRISFLYRVKRNQFGY